MPPKNDTWQRIAFQPMLYLCLWVGAIIVIVRGDFTSLPQEFMDNHHTAMFWLWAGLSLICPPMAMGAMQMIKSSNGYREYRGLWLRLGADIGQSSALSTYLVLRFSEGDYHVYPMAAVVAAGIFCWHIVLRDVKRLIEVEQLATQLHLRHYSRRE